MRRSIEVYAREASEQRVALPLFVDLVEEKVAGLASRVSSKRLARIADAAAEGAMAG